MPLSDQRISAVTYLLAAGLAVLALTLMVHSLAWEYSRDTPLLNYVGFLIWEHGFAPYRDVFETSMPGTLAFHSLVAGLGLAQNLPFILLGLGVIIGFSLLGSVLILPLGRAGAILAFPLSLTTMLMMGPGWILKIDMVALLPISAALCCAIWQRPAPVLLRQALIGLLFGIVATMKPHLMLGAPIAVLATYTLEHWTGRLRDLPVKALFLQITASLAGFAVPILLVVLWLTGSGAFDNFVFVVRHYLPLHLEKTDWQVFLPEEERQSVKFALFIRFGGHYPLVPLCAIAGLLAVLMQKRLNARQITVVICICLLAALYGLAPGLGGQFYVYYYFPFIFFCLLAVAASVSLVQGTRAHLVLKTVSVLCLTGLLAFHFKGLFQAEQLLKPARLTNVAAMEEALVEWVPEGGRVQPIDWTSGVVQAMLRQKILPATPYLYDYHFHHHVGGDINTGLREDFMAALRADPPEAFMQASSFPRVSGLNTSENFPARDTFLAENYRRVLSEKDFSLYLRRDLEGRDR